MPSDAVLNAIPHRAPFLFIDEIIEIAERRIVAKKSITCQEDFFRGHYPGHPIMPGVLIVESALQAGAILISSRSIPPLKGTPVVTKISDARFKNPVHPGDVLIIEATLDDVVSGAHYMTATIRTDKGVKIARVEFTVAMGS